MKQVMLRDWCTWDVDYNEIVQSIRRRLVSLATDQQDYTCVLMQGSGTFCVESVIGTAIPPDGKLLVLANGAYGRRIAQIAQTLAIPLLIQDDGETLPINIGKLRETLRKDADITHVAMVHCETTTGMLNDIAAVSDSVKQAGKVFILDAMSSFGGIRMDMAVLNVDFLVSSANKCIQGVPGFGFIIARKASMESCAGQARSLSLDMYDQWRHMESENGKWRYTSPTHVVRAFAQALNELEKEGGIKARESRYRETQSRLIEGMCRLGFKPLLERSMQSPIITSFHNPPCDNYRFSEFYRRLKENGFVIYPGKVSDADTFRIGNIGDVQVEDIDRLLKAIKENRYWLSSKKHRPVVGLGHPMGGQLNK